MSDKTLLTLTLQKDIDHDNWDEYVQKRDELIILLEDMGFNVDIEDEDSGIDFYDFDDDEKLGDDD